MVCIVINKGNLEEIRKLLLSRIQLENFRFGNKHNVSPLKKI